MLCGSKFLNNCQLLFCQLFEFMQILLIFQYIKYVDCQFRVHENYTQNKLLLFCILTSFVWFFIWWPKLM